MTPKNQRIEPIRCDVRPLYRVTFPIAYGRQVIKAGSLHRLEKVPRKNIEKLKARGTVSQVVAPPLRVLPGWSRRAVKLERAKVIDAAQFLGADVNQTAEYMRVKPETVERWKRDVLGWLTAPEQRR